MKKVTLLVLFFALLLASFSPSAFALTDSQEVDLDSMTLDELYDLQRDVFQKIITLLPPRQSSESPVAYPAGMYKVGVDLPEGEYVVIPTSKYLQTVTVTDGVGSDANTDQFYWEGYHLIVRGEQGLYVNIQDGVLYLIDDAPEIGFKDNILSEGVYIAGRHIPAGEYAVTLMEGEESGYCHIFSDYYENDYTSFNVGGKIYIEIKEGEYLQLSNCEIVLP